MKVYTLTTVAASFDSLDGFAAVLSTIEMARERMQQEYADMLREYPPVNEWGEEIESDIDESSAYIRVDADTKTAWYISETEIQG